MEINTTKHRIEQSGVKASYKFFLKANAKTFQMVMASLYSDPIKAFIRELSTNAYEAHQMVGIESTPFDVWLPTYEDLNFKIRDYGPGLSEDEVREIYTGLGESTKDQNNDLGGCFGLGSKSPFAYVTNAPFSVTSYHKGKKYNYVVYRDEEGIPCMDLLDVADGVNETGLEIKIPVRRNDITSIHEKAGSIYSWFNIKPNIRQKQQNIKFDNFESSCKMTEKNYEIHDNSIVNFVKMGNIIYPINFDILKVQKCFHGIIIHAPIGAVSPIPSRESLEYNGHTVSYLTDIINEINKTVINNFKQKISVAKNYYEAMRLAIDGVNMFPGVQLNQIDYNGRPLGDIYINIKYGKVLTNSYRTHRISFNSKSDDFSYRSDYGFFVSDSSASQIRIGDYCKANNIHSIVLCDKDKVKDCANEIGIDESWFVKTSTLPYTPPLKGTKRGTSNSHKTKVLKWKGGSWSCTSAWEDVSIDLTTEKGYYVEYYANKIKFKTRNGRELIKEPNELCKIIECLGLPDTTIVYGIKTELLKKVENKMPNMENLLTKVENWLYNNENVFKDVLKAKRTFDELPRSTFLKIKTIFDNNSHIIKPNSKLESIFKKYDEVVDKQKKYNNYSDIYTIITNAYLNQSYDTSICKPDKSLENEIIQFVNKYPLIGKIYNWMDDKGTELAYYILGKGY